MNDPLLKARDVITIYKSTNSNFVDVYGCINNPKHMPYMSGMTLADVISDLKFMESDIKTDAADYKASSDNGDLKLKVGTENANKLIIRVPVIPTFNDTPSEIGDIAKFAASLKGVDEINLLPYHRFGKDKYDGLGREYLMGDVPSPTDEHMNKLKAVAEGYGLKCKIGG